MREQMNKMEDVRKDICFIDSRYNTLFTIKDGDNIKVTLNDGEVKALKCRFIDETHFELIGKSHEYFHIHEFAQKMERWGNEYEAIPGQKPKLDVIAAKYGEPLQDVVIPMTDAAVKKLVGGNYEVEKLYGATKQYLFGALLRGKDGIAVCGIVEPRQIYSPSITSDTLTSLHPYRARDYKREFSPATPPKKPSLLDELEASQKEAAELNAAKAMGDKTKKRGEMEV